MQKQTRHNFTPVHLNLLQQLQNLFNRQNLCSNNYLYRQSNQNFEIPLNIISEQRKIAQISNNLQTIKEALQMCSLVEFKDNKTIKVIEYPTIKFEIQNKIYVDEIVQILKQKNKKVFTYSQDNLICLSLLERRSVKELEKFVNEYNKNLTYKVADLYHDWKTGTGKIRKLKQLNKKNYKYQKYSFDKPPAIFIRRAVQSSQDQQENQKKNVKKQGQKEREKEKEKEKEREKKYREKPIINQQDFPTLS